jgi:hypothetical protein
MNIIKQKIFGRNELTDGYVIMSNLAVFFSILLPYQEVLTYTTYKRGG